MNKILNNKVLQGLLAGAIITTFIFMGQSGIGAVTKFHPIKPVPNQTVLTDEQQGILAVREAKASVVNIVGNTAAATNADASISINTISGTGFIISPDGYIVSNNHVVQNATISYSVVFVDGSIYPAKIVGLDKYNDVALLKIDAQNLPAAKIGNSDSLETGQTVFAIGNSLGKYQNTVTKGVVSGLSRSISVSDPSNPSPRLQNLIQTDAAINPGNSGGPLINLAGEIVGMNTLIDAEGSSLGFAVPINVVKTTIDQLKSFGRVSKPYAGLSFATITPAIKTLKQLTIDEGALIAKVVPGGPADQAGIKEGDIITEINHQKLNQKTELDAIVNKYQAGTQVLITLFRNGQQMDMPLILSEFK